MSYHTHGHATTGNKSPEYKCWIDMKQRCFNSGNKHYRSYGGRGITVCDRWKDSFEIFLSDMGERPKGMTLDRKNNDEGYSPDNCRWATRAEQVANRKCSRLAIVNGETVTLKTACKILGLKYRTIRGRIDRGWSTEWALAAPLWSKKEKTND